jgi:hypothetical protein
MFPVVYYPNPCPSTPPFIDHPYKRALKGGTVSGLLKAMSIGHSRRRLNLEKPIIVA